MAAVRSERPCIPASSWSPEDNGHERFGWRMVNGQPEQIVIGIAFTIKAETYESVDSFTKRMRDWSKAVHKLFGYFVVEMKVCRRDGKAPWAEFDCITAEFHLPAFVQFA